MNYYRICGLNVAAEIDLPVAARLDPSVQPDAIVERGTVPSSLPDAMRRGPVWEIADKRVLLRIPGVARFLMSEGRELAFEPEPGRADSEIAIFLLGSAIGALLHQRGSLVLHASAVEVNGSAAIFCGPSGAGKSSLAASLTSAGHRLITDDVCVIQFDRQGNPCVTPDGRGLKLWSDALDGLTIDRPHDTPVRPGIEKYWVVPPTPFAAVPVPLRGIYFLREAKPPHEAGISPLSLLTAVETLRANAYRPRLVAALDQEGEWLQQSMILLRRASAFWLTRHKKFSAVPETLEMLRTHWTDTIQ